VRPHILVLALTPNRDRGPRCKLRCPRHAADADRASEHETLSLSQEKIPRGGGHPEGREGREGTSTPSRTGGWRRWTPSYTISMASPATPEEV